MRKSFLLSIGLLLLLSGCGFPGYSLNSLEKQADIEWLYGVFERNYAPAEWKQTKWGVGLAQSKANCIKGAESVNNGDEFISHLSHCVSSFKDAHTHLQAGGQILPETAQVAYLGFTSELARVDANNVDPCSGKNKEKQDCKDREKDKDKTKEPPKADPRIIYALKVKKLLPSTKAAGFPLAESDVIVAINGIAVEKYLLDNLLPTRDLGNDAASLTVMAQEFPLRTSYNGIMPKEENVRLTILKSPKATEVELPWTRSDLLDFQGKQNQAAGTSAKSSTPSTGFFVGEEFWDDFFRFATLYRNGAGSRVNLILSSTFKVFGFQPALNLVEKIFAEEKKDETPAFPFDSAAPGPVVDVTKGVFKSRVVLMDDGARIGYIKINDFSLDESDVKIFQGLLNTFTKMKVKGIILDTLDNGGGSLTAGLAMINALTPKEINYPSMQFALNDNWVNGFRGDSIQAPSDAARTRAARISKILKEDLDKGLRISRPLSTAELDLFGLTADKANCEKEGKCLPADIKLVLLTNEMCASMCDIFASSFHDNKLGTIIGSQTMGAGGNVVMHAFAPVTQVMVSQTESLIVDVNGEYLENQGVKPDVAVDTILERSSDFAGVYGKAFEALK